MLNVSSLNEAQREAVMHGSGPLLVLAGPGSGKTHTITQRIFYLLEQEKVPPEKILVITFTKDAALSMQSRFLQSSERTYPVNFGTFHSVFYHILKDSNTIHSNQILTDAQKKKIIIPILKKYLSKEELQYRQNDLSEEAVIILAAISFYKNTGDKEGAVMKLSEDFQGIFPTVLREYEYRRKQENAIDFDDMVYECYKILNRNKNIRKYWQQRFSHILIDEFQDINPMQYEVIRLLSSTPFNLFAVGDDDQSIYGFRGSKPACLRSFAEDYQAKQICLTINYRSRKEIIQASLTMIGENKDRLVKRLVASADKEKSCYEAMDVVKIHSFEEREKQYGYLISQLKKEQANKSIAVLFRTNTYMQSFAALLSKEGIGYRMKEQTMSIYEHFIVKDIVAYMKVASGKGSRALFLQIMNRPSRYINREALGLREEVPSYYEMMQYYRDKEFQTYHCNVIRNLEQIEHQMKYLKGLSPYLAVHYIRKVIGYEKYLKDRAGIRKEQWQEWEELLNWLSMDAANYESAEAWFEAQELYTKSMEEGQKKKMLQGESEEQINIFLMTVHGSKGLEFDKVYIPDCNEKIFPHGQMPDEKSCEEERRIFYVAMTRAKENLELLYLTGTKERPRLPSRFLNKLLKNYSSTISSNSQLSRYSSKASATFSYTSSSSIYSNSGSSLGSSGFSL